MSDSIQRTKLSEDVANRIIERIRSQEWEPGTRLPSEPDLAAIFSVSRATVRTSVKMLQLSGIIRSKGGSGNYVQENALEIIDERELAAVISEPKNVYKLVQARYILEPQLSALAAKNATESECAQLFSIVREMEKCHDRHALMAHGYHFHQMVAKFSHNHVLYNFCQSIAVQLRGMRVLDSLTLETFLEGVEEHRSIAKAICEHNDALSKELMRAHLKKDYALYLEKADILE